MTREIFSSSAFGGGGVCVGGHRRVGVGVGVVGGKGVVVAVKDRRFAGGGSRWLGWEAVGSRAGSGDKAVLAVAASHATHVSFAHS